MSTINAESLRVGVQMHVIVQSVRTSGQASEEELLGRIVCSTLFHPLLQMLVCDMFGNHIGAPRGRKLLDLFVRTPRLSVHIGRLAAKVLSE